MDADLQTYLTFFLTGKIRAAHLEALGKTTLRPILFAGYRDLAKLRYDFPLVLLDDVANGEFVQSLSAVFDQLLASQNSTDERLKKHLLALEQEIRELLAQGEQGRLSELWDKAALSLIKSDKTLADDFVVAKTHVKVDGRLIDCDAKMPHQLISHALFAQQQQRAHQSASDIKRLIVKLSELLKADFAYSTAGKSAEKLKEAFGSGPMDQFDFVKMSAFLAKSAANETLSAARRQRIETLLSTLEAQQFFSNTGLKTRTYSFAFDSCDSALKAYRERLPKMIELAKAIAVAELEIKGEYNETKHDSLFNSLDSTSLDAKEMGRFPDYLVHLTSKAIANTEYVALINTLSAGLPFKILLQADDLIDESPIDPSRIAFSQTNPNIVNLAIGLNTVFVAQAPASHLYQSRETIAAGLDYAGAALFSVFSGASHFAAQTKPRLPAYLIAAAALEARVFPALTYDPTKGADQASRFSLAGNPQCDNDWAEHDVTYEDEKYQRVLEKTPFTWIDFAALDPRYHAHFASIPQPQWSCASLVPVREFLLQENPGKPFSLEQIPYLAMVDEHDTLHRVAIDEKLLHEAQHSRARWNALQELGGIHNSHAQKLLAAEKARWEEAATCLNSKADDSTKQAAPALTTDMSAANMNAIEDMASEPSPEGAYIESTRCSSCNECMQINNKMFAYNENKQAFITDVTLGSYAQLVEAAENCQVSIIHPGKPSNPKESDLDSLVKRAALFA